MFARCIGAIVSTFAFGFHYSRYFGNNQLCQLTMKMFSIYTAVEAVALHIHGTEEVMYLPCVFCVH